MNAFDAASSGFRKYKVVGKKRESSVITSFHLAPLDPADWRSFVPGQFLILRIPAHEGDAVLRSYSLSLPPSHQGTYRITVKREAAPAPGLPSGLSSSHLHDHVDVGDVLEAQGPRGGFVLDRESSRPVVLLSGGVGLTPMIAMLHELASTGARRVHFIHACDNGEVHALREEVETLCASRPGLGAHFCYREPTVADLSRARHHSSGLISKTLLQSLLPLDDYDVYLCGPPPFMKALYEILRSLGVGRERIAYEFFGPATVLDEAPPRETPGAAESVAEAGDVIVEFRRSGVTASWRESSKSLLAFAESCGLTPDFSCRAGVCDTCKSHLVSGSVAYFEEPLSEPGPGEVLLCCSRPRSSVVIDI
ncbi:MAG: FAD-binding oxidoreductase [Pseudomonadota bacterium]